MCGGAQMRAGEHATLLIRLAIPNHPPCGMPALRVVVCPMDDAAFFVPDILAEEANGVAYLKLVDSRGDVDVVCDENCLSRRKLNNESLVSRPALIVRQNANHRPLAFNLYAAHSTREGAADRVVVYGCRRTRTGTRDEERLVRASSNKISLSL